MATGQRRCQQFEFCFQRKSQPDGKPFRRDSSLIPSCRSLQPWRFLASPPRPCCWPGARANKFHSLKKREARRTGLPFLDLQITTAELNSLLPHPQGKVFAEQLPVSGIVEFRRIEIVRQDNSARRLEIQNRGSSAAHFLAAKFMHAGKVRQSS